MHLAGFLDFFTLKIIEMGLWFYWLALLVSFLESFAFVGAIIPGTAVIIFIGFLGGAGVYDMGDMLIFVAAGGVLGDLASYYLGTKGTHLFKNENRFLKRSHLAKGEKFFHKHGGKSIFWARFIGPIRSIIPFVAGLSKMNVRVFLIWNAIGAVMFSAVFLYAGYFFGTIWDVVRVWLHRAEWLGVGIFLLTVVVYYFSEDFSIGLGKDDSKN